MNIGLNTLFLIPGKVGGTETYARGLIKGLEKDDHNNKYLAFCNRENYRTFNFGSKNFKKILCPIPASFRPLRMLWEQLVLPLQLYFKKVEVLLSLGYVCPIFVPCKSIVVIFDLNWFFHPEEFTFFSRLAWKMLVTLSAKRADHIITSSENSKKDILRILKVDPKKVSVVYGGIDRQKFKPIRDKKIINKIKYKYGISGEYIFTVSAAYKFKNLGKLIDAYKILSKKIIDIKLLIVGLGGRGKLEILQKIDKYRLQDKVIVAGWVTDEDLPILYSAAEVYVHPSLYEGFGFPVLEAMACGCPVVSSDSASLPELVGNACLLVDATNPKAISETAVRIVTDDVLRRGLIEKGNKRAKLFSLRKASLTLLNVIKNNYR